MYFNDSISVKEVGIILGSPDTDVGPYAA